MSKPGDALRVSQQALKFCSAKSYAPRLLPIALSRCLTTVQSGRSLPGIWFSGSNPGHSPTDIDKDHRKPPDKRTVKLGKTLRILQDRLPSLLQHPLPTEILSPQISLHLFPSTHPHLPTVTGRVAYIAALWTSPIAWGRVPIVGNVKLEILSERMIKKDSGTSPIYYTSEFGAHSEQLVVRWRTLGKTRGKGTGGSYRGIGASEQVDKITEFLGGGKGEDDSKEFTGLFIFEFDEEGRIVSHTIEHVQEGGNWENGVGARVVGLTHWLLGGMKGNGERGSPCPACYSNDGDSHGKK
ncbi:MAG: hypothetical protein M1818_003957 [Claussenomyces sp. TS43310]|nr:MAG: hypothetical protein M1818_003957 [Claussenomyces sp. TS43310]